MSLDKYTTPKSIKKVVDQGIGDLPSRNANQKPKTPENSPEQQIQETSLSTRIEDLISEAQFTQQMVLSVISEIDETNNSDATFRLYHQMVKENHFNPANLLQNLSLRPSIKHQPNAIKALERDVYRSNTDPRAPFVQDLYDHLADAGLSEYVLTAHWKKLVNPNQFFGGLDGSNLPNFALGKEEQHLKQLRESADRIKRNKIVGLSYNYFKAVSSKLIDQLHAAIPQDQIAQLNKLIKLLEQIKVVLLVVSIFNTENWEKFYSNIKDIYNDFLQITAAKVTKTAAFPFISGIHDKIFELLDGFEEYIPFDVQLSEIPESQEFMNQIYSCFGKLLGAVEEDFVYREGIQIKLEENRQLLLHNSQKNSKTKQYINAIDSAIGALETIKATLYSLNESFQLDAEILAQQMIIGADSYIRSISERKVTPKVVTDKKSEVTSSTPKETYA